ncbi:hypothetical protein, partial [Massilibacteroides sp.]|uniref:hypothetical protein n=1 Tax=Massilibacteroides sp. TaxID=2034766 RepID=UPI002607E452
GAANLKNVIGEELYQLYLSKEGHLELKTTVGTAVEEMITAWNKLQEDIAKSTKDAGVDINNLGQITDQTAKTIIADSGLTESHVSAAVQRMNEAIKQQAEQTGSWAKDWTSHAETVINAINDLIAKYQELKTAQTGAKANFDTGVFVDYSAKIGAIFSGYLSQGYDGKQAFSLTQGDKNAQALLSARANDSAYSQWKSNLEILEGLRDGTIIWDSTRGFVKSDGSPANMSRGVPFLSGGLAHGPMEATLAEDGKKELVLNNSDTINILETVRLIREVFGQKFRGISSSVTAALSRVPNPDKQLQQKVDIEANFPGVTAAVEIEDALTGLINRASQYSLE